MFLYEHIKAHVTLYKVIFYLILKPILKSYNIKLHDLGSNSVESKFTKLT